MKKINNHNVSVDIDNKKNISYNYQPQNHADYCMNYQYQGEYNCFQNSQMDGSIDQTKIGKVNKKNCKIIISFVISLVVVAVVFFMVGFGNGEKRNRDEKNTHKWQIRTLRGHWMKL